MNLLDQSLWWLAPFVLLLLVMLHAMMEFTVSLLVQRPQTPRKPIPAEALRRRLLAANDAEHTYQILEGKDSDLEIYWEPATPQAGRTTFARGASSGRIRMLLDPQRAELRINQVSRSYYFFFGFAGWLPRLGGYASAQSGPPGQAMTGQISRIANLAGWSVRPVLWWFQATHRGFRTLERLTPGPWRGWPARRFWGVMYPLSYILAMAYIVLVGSLEPQDLLLLAGISVAWWGIWGFLAWILTGMQPFWRRGGR